MALEPMLKRWTEAGLLQPEQAERISRFEKERGRPTLLYAISALAALAMAIGLISIVAANWDEIPAPAKLSVDLVLLAGLGYGVLSFGDRGPAWLSEASILLLYGLTLASIALVGQVYQLGGKIEVALAVWTLLTAVLMAQGRTLQLGFVWLSGLELTYFVWLATLGDHHRELEGLVLTAILWPGLACIALGRAGWLDRSRPQFSRVASALGWAQLVLFAIAGTFTFYDQPTFREERWFWLGAALSALACAGLLATTPNTPSGRARRSLIVVAFVAAHLGAMIPHGDWPVAAALAFMALWWAVAVAAHRAAQRALLHFATAMIGLRLIVIYFEVFGTLLDTGIALLIGGMLTLLLTWLWARQRRELDRELGAADKAGGGARP
jgi:uncharacterized membrane protein